MIDILALSDLHGNLINIKTPFDLMLIGGDIAPAHDHYYSFQKEWLKYEFVPWINKLPFKSVWSKVVIIGGNHDIWFEREGINSPSLYSDLVKPCNGRLVVLRNQEYIFDYLDDGLDTGDDLKQLKIFGTPWCKIFGNWFFMATPDKLREKYSEIPNDCDILLCHDAPFGHNDECLEWLKRGKPLEHIGNPQLRSAIEDKQPKLSLHGHLHSTDHNRGQLGDTITYNVSILDELYCVSYIPLHLQYDGTTFKEVDSIDDRNKFDRSAITSLLDVD